MLYYWYWVNTGYEITTIVQNMHIVLLLCGYVSGLLLPDPPSGKRVRKTLRIYLLF